MSNSVLLFCTVLVASIGVCVGGRGQLYNVDETGEGQRNYQEDEQGKILPHRTFLTPLEIALICIFCILGLVLIVLCCIYLCWFGCVCPPFCRTCCHQNHHRKPDYSQIQLHRERKIDEIWQNNHPA